MPHQPFTTVLLAVFASSAGFAQSYKIATFAGGGLPIKVTLVAGTGIAGFSGDNGPATSAQLNGPQGVAVDNAGNVYIADTLNNRIRRVSGGVITTITDISTCCLAVDSAGNLYFAQNSTVRVLHNGVITVFAGTSQGGYSGDNGPATAAQLEGANALAVDSAGNLYISDSTNHRIRKVAGGIITTIAGNGMRGFSGDNGPATAAALNLPWGVGLFGRSCAD